MYVRIDPAGRIVVPKAVRDRFGLKPDTEIELIEQPDGALLRVVAEKPAMRQVNGLWVHEGRPERGARWESLVAEDREERARTVLGE